MPGLLITLCAASLLQTAPSPAVAAAPTKVALATAPTGLPAGNLFVEQDTPIRLMVLNEVSTKTAKPGDRFVLRVDENVVVDGVTIVPVGSKAWGEVMSAEGSGAVGKSGKLQARLLYVDIGGAQIPISGENRSSGERGSTAVILGAFALGPLALFAPGNNAKLKAGEIFSAYFNSDLAYDPATATLSALPVAPLK